MSKSQRFKFTQCLRFKHVPRADDFDVDGVGKRDYSTTFYVGTFNFFHIIRDKLYFVLILHISVWENIYKSNVHMLMVFNMIM